MDPSNRTLLTGFRGGYRYAANQTIPKKDGRYDPLFDALRYLVVHNFTPSGETATRETRQPMFAVRRRTTAVA